MFFCPVCVCVCVWCVMGVVDVSVCQHKNRKKFVYRNNKWSKYPLWCCSHGIRLKAYLRLTGHQICFSVFKGFLIETHPIPCRVTYLSHLLLPLFLFSTCSANHVYLQNTPCISQSTFPRECHCLLPRAPCCNVSNPIILHEVCLFVLRTKQNATFH